MLDRFRQIGCQLNRTLRLDSAIEGWDTRSVNLREGVLKPGIGRYIPGEFYEWVVFWVDREWEGFAVLTKVCVWAGGV